MLFGVGVMVFGAVVGAVVVFAVVFGVVVLGVVVALAVDGVVDDGAANPPAVVVGPLPVPCDPHEVRPRDPSAHRQNKAVSRSAGILRTYGV